MWAFNEVHSWDLTADAMPAFYFPTGVLPAVSDAGTDPDTIREAFSRDPDGDFVEVVVDERRLWNVFVALFDGLPARDGFEIRLMHHLLEQDHTEVWIGNPRYRDDAITRYLSTNPQAILRNGGVALSVYSRDSKCTLRITDHKLITLYSPSPNLVQQAVAQLHRLGFGETDPLVSIAVDCPHFHFAPPGAPTAEDLQKQLLQDGFRLARTIPRDDE